jgi:hypothetical protein
LIVIGLSIAILAVVSQQIRQTPMVQPSTELVEDGKDIVSVNSISIDEVI